MPAHRAARSYDNVGPGVGEPVGVGAGFDDGAVVGEPVHDRGAQAGVGEGVGPPGERLVRGDRDGVLLFELGEDMEEKFGAAAVEFQGVLGIGGVDELFFALDVCFFSLKLFFALGHGRFDL